MQDHWARGDVILPFIQVHYLSHLFHLKAFISMRSRNAVASSRKTERLRPYRKGQAVPSDFIVGIQTNP